MPLHTSFLADEDVDLVARDNLNRAQGSVHRELAKASSQYFDLANTSGGTPAKYLVFNEPVLINLGKQTYLIEPPSRPQEMLSPVRAVAAIPGTKTSPRVRPTRQRTRASTVDRHWPLNRFNLHRSQYFPG